MKKILCLLFVATLVFTGCESKTYKEGVYEGAAIDTYGGAENTATAKITINSEGKITDVYLDTTYVHNGVETTKKALKDEYGMKKGNSSYGTADYEWYEQVEALEKAVVENQGIEFLNLDENGKIDAVSNCTIVVDALYEALENALNKAK